MDARRLGLGIAVSALLDRDPAGQVSLSKPKSFARLLQFLSALCAAQQTVVLTNRIATDGDLARDYIFRLSRALREMGATEQVRKLEATLKDRIPAADEFDLFSRQAGHQARYMFGRETDGSPSVAWGWDDLE